MLFNATQQEELRVAIGRRAELVDSTSVSLKGAAQEQHPTKASSLASSPASKRFRRSTARSGTVPPFKEVSRSYFKPDIDVGTPASRTRCAKARS